MPIIKFITNEPRIVVVEINFGKLAQTGQRSDLDCAGMTAL